MSYTKLKVLCSSNLLSLCCKLNRNADKHGGTELHGIINFCAPLFLRGSVLK